MRRINSEFQTRFLSEEGQALVNRDYFGYAELDDFACYVLADSLDGEPLENSARIVVESLIRSFSERGGWSVTCRGRTGSLRSSGAGCV